MRNKKDKKGKLDKVLMGAVIGGAIGSVLGASIAPKKGEDTRKEIIDMAKKAQKTSKGLFTKVRSFIKNRGVKDANQKEIPHEES